MTNREAREATDRKTNTFFSTAVLDFYSEVDMPF